MTRRIALLLALALALLEAATAHADIRIKAGKSASIDVPNATAAYSLDPDVAGVSFARPEITIVAYREGVARVAIITPAGLETLDVVVTPRESLSLLSTRSRSALNLESRYDSWSERFDQRVSFSTSRDGRQTRAEIRHSAVSNAGSTDQYIPWATWRFQTPSYTLTLLDAWVSESVLTMDRRLVRGVHLDAAGFRAHAGYSFYSLLGQTFLPKDERERVIGLSYDARLTDRSTVTPHLYRFDGEAGAADRSGTIGSLEYKYDRGSELTLAAEAAVSRLDETGELETGFALRSDYRTDRDQARLDFRYRPAELAGLRREVSGSFGDASWRHVILHSLDATANVTFQDFSISGYEQTSTSSGLTFAYRPNSRWGFGSGGRYALLQPGSGPEIEQFEIPFTISYRRPSAGGAAEYRYIENSHSNEGGHLVRFSGYGRMAGARATLWAERETNAPTLAVIFREQPGLALLLAELGIIVASPFELSRVLRENPALAELGFIEGVTFNLSPVSYRAGGTLAWMERGASSFRLTTNYRRDEGISRTREAGVAFVSFSHHLGASLDLETGYSRSFTRSGADDWSSAGGWHLGIRKRFDDSGGNGLSLFRRRGEISGYVFLDEESTGRFQPGMTVLPGIEVVLDDEQRVRTDARGFFEFRRVPEGVHKVQAIYLSDKPFKFTTPSPAQTEIGETVNFGIASIAGRLFGVIESDQKIAIDGVTVSIDGAGVSKNVVVRGGRYSIDVPRPGAYLVSVERASVPSGYSLLGIEPKEVTIADGQPSEANFVIPAIRSIGGTVERGGAGSTRTALSGAVVRLEEDGRSMTTDAEGRYLFRDVAPGRYTVVAEHGAMANRRSIAVPKGPAAMRSIDLLVDEGLLTAASRPAKGRRRADSVAPSRREIVRQVAADDAPGSGSMPAKKTRAESGDLFAVQLGVYRQETNALRAVETAARESLTASIDRQRSLHRVVTAPFASRAEADAAAKRLRRAGLETTVIAAPASLIASAPAVSQTSRTDEVIAAKQDIAPSLQAPNGGSVASNSETTSAGIIVSPAVTAEKPAPSRIAPEKEPVRSESPATPAASHAMQKAPTASAQKSEAAPAVAQRNDFPAASHAAPTRARRPEPIRMLQSGSHRNVSSAAATVKIAESQGLQAVIRNSGTFFEVLIGPFASDQAVGVAQRELEKRGIRTLFVIESSSPFAERVATVAGLVRP
ncbi:MAG TPA: carboxypeptidase regulatory-like domain-containing protein [Thermoanaerobaculia bacterium]|nr:carboxypeptidase regulatory-like domain-containing protein [Thermoanaerobaculia bacterium]